MKYKLLSGVIVIMLLSSGVLYAQDATCIFLFPQKPGEKEAFRWSEPEKKMVLKSEQDSLVFSPNAGTMLTVVPAEEGGYQLAWYEEDHYFWLVGISQPLVRNGEKIRPGQPLGRYTKGTLIEFRVFLEEKPIDPRPFLRCFDGKQTAIE